MDGVESASSEIMTAGDGRSHGKLEWRSLGSTLLLAVGVALTFVWAGVWVWILVALAANLF
jgi:hypothetical protein